MKEILLLMARYNQTVNSQMYSLIEAGNQEVLTYDSGSYFKNVLGLLNHILVSDLGWLSAFRNGNLKLPILNSPVLDYENPGWRKNLYQDFTELKDHRYRIDSLMLDFITETPEELFAGDIRITRRNNEVHSFPFGKILMHLFNHQTHHRGAVSQILDEKDVENDYSNLMGLLMK